MPKSNSRANTDDENQESDDVDDIEAKLKNASSTLENSEPEQFQKITRKTLENYLKGYDEELTDIQIREIIAITLKGVNLNDRNVDQETIGAKLSAAYDQIKPPDNLIKDEEEKSPKAKNDKKSTTPSVPVESLAPKVAGSRPNKPGGPSNAIDPRDPANRKLQDAGDIATIPPKIGFQRVRCVITVNVGGTLFVLKQVTVRTANDKFTWRQAKRSFNIDTNKVAYVSKVFLRGALPHLIYDLNHAEPLNMTKRSDLKYSSQAFNRVFQRNLIEQGLAALTKTSQVNPTMIIMGVVMGIAIGWLLGIFINPFHLGGAATTTVTSPGLVQHTTTISSGP